MWRRIICATCCLWQLFCLPVTGQDTGEAARPDGSMTAQIRRELNAMRISVTVLKESLRMSRDESATLQMRCDALEKRLTEALSSLDRSDSQLTVSQRDLIQLQQQLEELRTEYNELSEYCRKLKRQRDALTVVAIISAAAAAGLGIYAVVK